jgi:hypothetical protein
VAAKTKTLDFSGVEDRAGNFRPRRKPEGDYYAVITDVSDHTSKEGNDGWVFTVKVNGDSRATYPYYCNFDKEQLWKSRGLCIAAGLKVPSSKVKMDPNKLVGRGIGIALEDDEYEGRMKSVIAAVFPKDDISDARNDGDAKSSKAKAKSRQAEEDDDEDDDEDEEEETPKRKGKKSRKPEPDDDEDEDEDEESPAKSKKGKSKSKKSRDDDDEDEDDDEPPAKKSKSKKKGKKARDEDDDDDELDIDDL